MLNLPETALTTLSSVHTVNSGKAKTKHTAWQGFREIPEALRILDNNDNIISTSRNAERSMIGAASDNKLFASRLVLETLAINEETFPTPPGSQTGPIVGIPNNIGVVDVEETSILFIPVSANPTLGQQVTFNFISGIFFAISITRDSANPPLGQFTYILRDSRGSPSNINNGAIVYSLLDLGPPSNVYGRNIISVKNTVSVIFTLTNINQSNGALNVTWTATSIPGESRLLGSGVTNIPIPSGAKNVRIIISGGGGSGGPINYFGIPTLFSAAGGGGAGGAVVTYTTSTTNLLSIIISVAAKVIGTEHMGNPTTLSLGYTNKIDQFVALGGNTGGTATAAGTSVTSAPGGSGNGATFIYNGQSITPPPNFTVINGTSGGNAGGAIREGTSMGFPGQDSFNGNSGGTGGTITSSLVTIVSGPGGGGAGFQGPGGSGGIFSIDDNQNPTVIGVAGPPAGPGGGGAGQGPIDIPGIVDGGSGSALVTFF